MKAFRGVEIDRVISSPHVRCVQTVRPLALDRGLPVETSDALLEGAPTHAALALLAELADTPTVVCSHGDVIPAVVLHLAERGVSIGAERDWQKGLGARTPGRPVRPGSLPSAAPLRPVALAERPAREVADPREAARAVHPTR